MNHGSSISVVTTISLILSFLPLFNLAQDYGAVARKKWLDQARVNKPVLHERLIKPVRLGILKKDTNAFQGWKVETSVAVDSLYQRGFKSQSGVIVDFGEHFTGYVSFSLAAWGRTPDAPLRLKFTFGEVPSELAVPFEPYSGSLSRAWLQDEIVTVSEVPSTLTIPRRLAFRYVKVELLSPSIGYDFKLTDLQIKATTSATENVASLLPNTSPLVKEIDRVGLRTLRECMQTVYEDGPKRDRRLWIGDLYLEALANDLSFKNHNLTKRCLYLLAALSNKEGYLHGTVFERPEPHPQEGQLLFDYALLYNVALRNYYKNTNDRETALDLWPVAKRQLELVKSYLMHSGLIDYDRAAKEIWIFIDWKDGLHKDVAIQGLAIYALKQTYELAKSLGKEHELAEVPEMIRKMSAAAKQHLFDKKTKLFLSGVDKQISYASQIWMILGGVVSKQEGAKIVNTLIAHKEALKPGGPYLYHYLLQAMIDCGMKDEAKETMLNYWGAMVEKGADTFWEVYDPADEYRSPYNFYPINSYCHAWSCTPVYFIRKYPEIFQD
ncbi:family 78 glycoside hydrolase catalytic domain [Olivibacter sitiensis]|uniref:alpha-L-rhamnosidase-related protein n=1 Tax=Olivibacter sitiensis TaxID=376470 RepID=UPI000416B326|nr:family 78 glycoside hydrolase catalytic domain [Olivibacter sitiensis]